MSEATARDTAFDTVDDADINQYVSFILDEECYAFPMSRVREIIRVPETVQVPLTPGSLIGLSNLRGSVVPVLSLRTLLGLANTEIGDSGRVLVIDHGRPVGLMVDRIASVMNVDGASVEDAANVQSSLNADLLSGALKKVQGRDLILLLDPDKVLDIEYGTFGKGSTARADAAKSGSDGDGDKVAIDEQTDQMVSFLVDGQEFAFPIDDVEEIVRVPDLISFVPKTESHVYGVISLRNRLLPLVGLRRMFSLPDRELDEDNRIVVIRLSGDGNRDTVGVIVDQVREVLRVQSALRDPVPELLFGDGGDSEIESVCRLQNGERLVSVLSVEAMFHHPQVREGLALSVEASEDTAMSRDEEGNVEDDDEDVQLVAFKLADEEFGVEIAAVQEIIRVPEQLSRVPKTAAFIEGMVNLRGGVLPVIDLRCRLGMERAPRDDRQRIMVLGVGGTQTGFIVDSVSEVLRLSRVSLETAPSMSEEQSRIMGRVANLRDSKRMILLIDPDCLLGREEVSQLRENLDPLGPRGGRRPPKSGGNVERAAAPETA